MEANVQTLLQEEKKVNAAVQEALAHKNELLRSIKREAEIAVLEYKKTLEQEHQRLLREVSHILVNRVAEKIPN